MAETELTLLYLHRLLLHIVHHIKYYALQVLRYLYLAVGTYFRRYVVTSFLPALPYCTSNWSLTLINLTLREAMLSVFPYAYCFGFLLVYKNSSIHWYSITCVPNLTFNLLWIYLQARWCYFVQINKEL